MALARYVVPALVGGLLWAVPLRGQDSTGTISGEVTDVGTQQGLAGVIIRVQGTPFGTQTRTNGGFTLTVPAGVQRLRVTRIGYTPLEQDVTVAAGSVTPVNLALRPQAAILEPVVVTGYGTQRREAITGSVATVDPATADVGVMTNVNGMLQGRVAGVNITTNNGEPGAGVQIRIRGATSISANNEPLYVIDGVPITNVESEAAGFGVGGTPPLPRSPLNLLNPSDIGSLTILKDASATAIYGSRGANGVILIETKKGASGGASMTYDSYVATASPAKSFDVLSGDEYRQFVQGQVAIYNVDTTVVGPDTTITTTGLPASYLAALGTANTDWAKAVNRTAVTHNHNLSFTGGSDITRYRASLNFMNQQGVALSSGFRRIQGRLGATHFALNNRLRIGLNVTTSQANNDYLAYENSGGFEGGVFQNVAVFNPTQPVTVTDSTGTSYYEIGPGSQSVRNPVALAEQIQDFGTTNRTLGNVSADLDLLPGLTGRINIGVDKSGSVRQIYLPRSSPVGSGFGGLAQQINRDNQSKTFQGMLTYTRQLGGEHDLDVVGVYEFSESRIEEFRAEARNFLTDVTGFNSLNSGSVQITPQSFRTDERWISFITRASYGYKQRYFVTGVVRRDGRSAFGAGHKWATFPGISASWRISDEQFMPKAPFSDLRLRAGYGVVGNPGVPPYSSLITLEASGGAKYVFGDQVVIGFAPVRNPNPNLRFEKTSQVNVALDYGLLDNRVSGSLEYYVKNTTDLLLEVPVAQPALATTRIQNIGAVRNRGLELSLDALAISRPNLTWRAGLVFATERNRVVHLGENCKQTGNVEPCYLQLTNTGRVSGQGQSDQFALGIIPSQPLGTFFGPEFVGLNAQGQQLFNNYTVTRDAAGRELSRTLNGTTTQPGGDDKVPIGNAYPDFTIGLHSTVNFGKFDLNVQMRGAFGQEVFNNTALVYSTKSNALQGKNFLREALTDPTDIREPAIFSSRWVEGASFMRLQNVTVGYSFRLPGPPGAPRSARVYVSGDNLLLLTGYSGLDPEVHQEVGLASVGVDYLSYPRPRTLTAGVQLAF
jgi:iron complex outermembrane receptor protein